MGGPLVNRGLLAKELREDKQAYNQYKSDLEWLMKTPQGRRLMYGVIFSVCGVEELSYLGDSTESTTFREGQRSVGIRLMRDLQENCTNGYIQMLREQISQNMRLLKSREEDRSKAVSEKEED